MIGNTVGVLLDQRFHPWHELTVSESKGRGDRIVVQLEWIEEFGDGETGRTTKVVHEGDGCTREEAVRAVAAKLGELDGIELPDEIGYSYSSGYRHDGLASVTAQVCLWVDGRRIERSSTGYGANETQCLYAAICLGMSEANAKRH